MTGKWVKSKGNWTWFELTGSSSYRGSTIVENGYTNFVITITTDVSSIPQMA